VKVRVAKRAQQQANKMEAWWVENRPQAPTLFLDELEQTFRYICNEYLRAVRENLEAYAAKYPDAFRYLDFIDEYEPPPF
jgi:hypothetical protein